MHLQQRIAQIKIVMASRSCALICFRYRAVQALVRVAADLHDELSWTFHGPCSSVALYLCSYLSLHTNGSPAVKPIEDIASAPGLPFVKALYKAVPSLSFGHGALSTLLARISKSSAAQVSLKGLLQQLSPAVAVLSPAILLLKSAAVAQNLPSAVAPALRTPASTINLPSSAAQASVSIKTKVPAASSSSTIEPNSSLARARANFRKLIRSRRPSSLDVLRMLGVSTSLFPSALSLHEASGKGSLIALLKTTGVATSSLQVSGMWPSIKGVSHCSVFDLRVVDAKFVPSAGAMYSSIHRKVRVTFCNGVDGFLGALATFPAKTHRGDDHSWDFPSAQVCTCFTYARLP